MRAHLAIAIFACTSLGISAGASAQTVYARAGFNDQSGINSNPTPGSPYTIGQSIANRGTGEPGWANNWIVQDGGAFEGDSYAIVKSAAAYEGDGGVEIIRGPHGSTFLIRTLAESRIDRFIFEGRVNVGSVGEVYTAAYEDHYVNGPVWRITGPLNNRHFEVFDGQSDQTGTWEDTGIAQKPGEWQNVVLDTNVVTQRYNFSVDGIAYNPPDPLGFEFAAEQLNAISYFFTGAGYLDDISVHSVAPEAWRVADVNNDGKVTVGDLGILSTHFNQTLAGGKSVGDLNLDGSVTVGDLGILATYFGQPAGSAVTFDDAVKNFPNLAAAVPEPASFIGFGLAAIPLLLRQRSDRLH